MMSKLRRSGAPVLDKPQVQIKAAQFAAKFKSKREVNQFLIVNARAYLCAEDCLNIYFLKDLVSGKKKCKYPKTTLLKPFSHKERDSQIPFVSFV